MLHGFPRTAPSNRPKFAVTFERKVLARLRQRYADFGPTLLPPSTWPRKGCPFEPGGGGGGGETPCGSVDPGGLLAAAPPPV